MLIKIVYEDENLIVIDKPAGLATQTKKAYEKDVVSELKKHLNGGYVGVVHRLDQPVEGLLVFAKNQQVAAALSKQVRQKGEDVFVKDYGCLLLRESVRTEQDLFFAELSVKNQDGKASVIDEAQKDKVSDVKLAKLKFEVISAKDSINLVRIHLETGRFHQIRAQLSNYEMPILGDRKYGTEKSLDVSNKLKLRHVLLCADQLSFVHPVTKETMSFKIASDDICKIFN